MYLGDLENEFSADTHGLPIYYIQSNVERHKKLATFVSKFNKAKRLTRKMTESLIDWKVSKWDRFDGKDSGFDAFVYCDDFGNILSMTPIYGDSIRVEGKGYVAQITGRIPAVRLYQYVSAIFTRISEQDEANAEFRENGLRIKKEHDEKVEELKKENAGKKGEVSISTLVTDERILRAFILFYYEKLKGLKEKQIAKTIETASSWSRKQAREWLERNGFSTIGNFYHEPINPKEENYLGNPSLLLNPYWKPTQK